MSKLPDVSSDDAAAYLHGLMRRARPRWENTSEGITAEELQHALDAVADYMDRAGNSDGEHYMAWLLRMARTMVMRAEDRGRAALSAIKRGETVIACELLQPADRYWSK